VVVERIEDPVEGALIPGRCQLYSTKLMIEDWSLALWSTKFALAQGEITSIGRRGPNPQRLCSPSSASPGPLPHSPEVPVVETVNDVFVRLSATECDGLITPGKTWSYQPSESS